MFRLHKKESNDLSIDSIPRERRAAILPLRDWIILVSVLSLFFVVISVWHGIVLWRIGNDTLVTVEDTVQKTEKKVNRADIDLLITNIASRASTTRMLDSRNPFVDPSW